jgi:ribosomal protein L37E
VRVPDKRPDPRYPSFTCPRCGMTSYNPNDIRYRYCGNCHAFTEDGGSS